MNQQDSSSHQECMSHDTPESNTPHDEVKQSEQEVISELQQESTTTDVSHDEITKAIEQEHQALLAHKPKGEVVGGQTFTSLLAEMKALEDSEKKLEHAVQFMQDALSQTGVPHFKEFWEVRRLCLDLFKENINPLVRMSLWTKYSELCRQARKLKEIFDEQSAFAVEQIEIAVSAIESEVAYLADLLEKMPEVCFEVQSHAITPHLARYKELQRELNLLNAYAIKTNTLRKELIKTEMRIRSKNKFFERLSKLGDAIFPRRKELIQQVSELFVQDVEGFISKTFADELKTQALFDARDEIKALQSVAKVLTLNTESFSNTRKSLSQCWDTIKDVVKERKKEVSEQRAQYKKGRDQFFEELETLKKRFEANELSDRDADRALDDILQRMRNTPLGKFEVRELRDKAKELQLEISQKAHAEEIEKKKEAKRKEQEAKERFVRHKELIMQLIDDTENGSLDECMTRYEELLIVTGKENFTRGQKQEVEALLRKIKDALTDLKDSALLSDDARMELSSLTALLNERKERRREIKSEIDSLKKLQGGSGLDISRAMEYNELMETQRARLEKIEAGICEIEEKIEQLHS